jgi:hypothetical protein
MKNAILLLSVLLVACASSDSMVQTRQKAKSDPHVLKGSSDCISESLVSGFNALDDRHLLLYGSGSRRVFLVEISPACFDLKYRNTLAVVDGDNNGQICGFGRDSIGFEQFGRVESCRIMGMEELSEERRLEVLGK